MREANDCSMNGEFHVLCTKGQLTVATNEHQFVSSGCWKATFSYPPNYILVIFNESNTQLALKFPPQVHPSATCVPT